MSVVSANLHRHPENAEVSDEARGHRPATYRAHCGSFFPPSRDLSLLLLSFVPFAGFAFFADRLFGPDFSDDSERPGRAPGTEFDFLSSATRSWTILRCCRATPLGSCGVVCNPDTAAVLARAAINAICKDMCSLAFQWSSCRVYRVMTPANHLEFLRDRQHYHAPLVGLQSSRPCRLTTDKSRRQRGRCGLLKLAPLCTALAMPFGPLFPDYR